MSVTISKSHGPLDLEDIHFGFEDFLKEHEENLPQGLDPQYLAYVSILEHPFRNIRQLPKALRRLPMNALLFQSWTVLYKLVLLIIIIGSPSLVLIVITASTIGKTGIGVILALFILIGVAISPGYLKLLYGMIGDLIDTKKAPWLVETIEKPFDDNYQRPWKLSYFYVANLLALVLDFSLVWLNLVQGPSRSFGIILLWSFFLIWSHFGAALMLYISILSYRYVAINSRIYDQLMIRITERVKGYTGAQESILSKKNYEVVGILSDTPGLSIRSLGDIPILGLASSTLIFNAIIFLVAGPILISTGFGEGVLGDATGLTLILLIGLIFSILAAFGAVFYPILRVFWIIRQFKNKALKELDPFLFDEITGVALKRDTEISNETQVLYMLRNYIYIMKTSPVNPFRALQIAILLFIYITRMVPTLARLL